MRGEIGSHIRHGLDREGEEAALRVERQPSSRAIVAPLGRAQEILRPLADPAHGAPETARGEEDEDPFGIEEILHPEAAADIGRRQMNALLRHPEDRLGELLPDAMHTLAREEEVEA